VVLTGENTGEELAVQSVAALWQKIKTLSGFASGAATRKPDVFGGFDAPV
jgi:hypothetical protein